MTLKYGPYSPSRLETATCGYSFYKQYIEPKEKGIPRPNVENLPQARGSALHEVLENVARYQLENKVVTESIGRQWVVEAIGRHPAAYEETDVILQMVKRYVHKPIELTTGTEIELRMAVKQAGDVFAECDYDDPEAFARGRADIMMISDDTTAAKIIDHKTYLNTEEKADTFQMGFYAWVMWKTYPFLQNIITQIHFARFGMHSDEHTWTLQELAKIEDEIMTRVAIVESRQEWAATPHKGCQYCPFTAECPVMKEFVEIRPDGRVIAKADNFEILGSPDAKIEKARLVASVVHALDTVSAKATNSLKEYIKEIGLEVSIPGVSYYFKTEEKVDWDKVNKKHKDAVAQTFEKHHIDPKRFMVFSSTSTKGLHLIENDQLLKELHKLLPRHATTRFTTQKT